MASRRHEVRRRTRRRYQNVKNRYQSANVTAGLSRQRDADSNVTDTAAQVRREWRRADTRSCDGRGVAIRLRTTATNPRTWRRACRANVTPTRTSRTRRRGCAGSGVTLSQCRTWTRSRYRNTNNRYQSANVAMGLSCQRGTDRNVTDTAARVRQGLKKDLTFSCIAIIFLLNPIWNHTFIRFSVTRGDNAYDVVSVIYFGR